MCMDHITPYFLPLTVLRHEVISSPPTMFEILHVSDMQGIMTNVMLLWWDEYTRGMLLYVFGFIFGISLSALDVTFSESMVSFSGAMRFWESNSLKCLTVKQLRNDSRNIFWFDWITLMVTSLKRVKYYLRNSYCL